MKKLILVLLLLPLLVEAKSYKYDKVQVKSRGNSDFFMAAATAKNENSGIIKLLSNYLYIDGRKYELKKKKDNNTYRSNSCLVKFGYNDNELASVEIIGYDHSILYEVLPENKIVASVE